VGYAAMNKSFDYTTILLALAGVLLIGFTNFIVSFSITLLLTLKSRGATFRILPQLLSSVLRDFIRRPLGYFFFQAEGIPEAIKPPGK
jgi:site-specific recombinase